VERLIIDHARRELARTEAQLAGRLEALRSTVASWTTTSVPVGDTMNAASTLTEIATLSALATAQREALTLIETVENS
jgi:hypothetical protein